MAFQSRFLLSYGRAIRAAAKKGNGALVHAIESAPGAYTGLFGWLSTTEGKDFQPHLHLVAGIISDILHGKFNSATSFNENLQHSVRLIQAFERFQCPEFTPILKHARNLVFKAYADGSRLASPEITHKHNKVLRHEYRPLFKFYQEIIKQEFLKNPTLQPVGSWASL